MERTEEDCPEKGKTSQRPLKVETAVEDGRGAIDMWSLLIHSGIKESEGEMREKRVGDAPLENPNIHKMSGQQEGTPLDWPLLGPHCS